MDGSRNAKLRRAAALGLAAAATGPVLHQIGGIRFADESTDVDAYSLDDIEEMQEEHDEFDDVDEVDLDDIDNIDVESDRTIEIVGELKDEDDPEKDSGGETKETEGSADEDGDSPDEDEDEDANNDS